MISMRLGRWMRRGIGFASLGDEWRCWYEADVGIGSDLVAIAKKEVEWIRRFGTLPGNEFPHSTMFPGVCSHEDYLRLLEVFGCYPLSTYWG